MKSVSSSGAAVVHYDSSVLRAGGECCSVASCDDNNPCTVESCAANGACVHTLVTNGTACNDGNACSRTDTCQAGTCTGSNPVTCAASDQCHSAGTCNPATGTCSNPVVTEGTACNDGNACSQTDKCQAGACVGSNPVSCTAPDQCHSAGTCNPATGACTNPAVADGTACNDGNACSQTDKCQAGVCTGSSPVACAAADQCHAAGTCNPATGACTNPPVADGTACNDGNACSQTDKCQAGVCTGSNPVNCAASDQCHSAGSCNPSTGTCSNPALADGTACNDGNACSQTDKCQAGICAGSNPKTCAASDQCHAAGTCNPSTGACSNPALADGTACNDGNACSQTDKCQAGVCAGSNPKTCAASDQCHTAGTCNPSTGACSNPALADGTACNDGNACSQTDKCQAGACVGSSPVSCTASDQCHSAGTCNPSTGACTSPALADGTACNDGNACSQTDKCQAGACVGSNAVSCAASDQCHSAGTCNPTTGACTNPAIADGTACNDGNACSQTDRCQAGVCTGSNPIACAASDQCHAAGTCNPSNGTCSNPAVADGTACSDGNACSQTDKCQAGACVGSNPVSCAASDQCHSAGSCNPTTGACTNPAVVDGTACNDGDACSRTDTCRSGTCTGSNLVTCAAADQCHAAGSCNPSTGTCSSPTLADGTACNDGNACTRSDSCMAGACTGSNPVTCGQPDQCHAAGTCDPSSGACSSPAIADGTPCSDGNACTRSDTCQSGTCTGASPVACAASDSCHIAGSCDPATGSCTEQVAPDGTACSDGNGCTQGDHCEAGRCNAVPVQCIASDACHEAGTCDAATGVCSNPNSESCPAGMPPDPATVAPPLDRTVATSVAKQIEFLYSGSNPIQSGVAAGTIAGNRAAEIHGRVLREDLSPLPGVVVSIPAHPEYGQTATRADGRFNLVVNGGGSVTLDFAKPSYLPAQRDAAAPWNEYYQIQDVILLQPSTRATVVDVGSAQYQVARGDVETDASGTRQGIVLVPNGTLASAVMPDGTRAPLGNLTLRITEYTVGENGPKRMPADLPPDSAYTYAVDVSADEANAIGASHVEFNQPIVYYLDNFLGMPPGVNIPVGSYNRGCGSALCAGNACSGWKAEDNGRIITILDASSGVAAVDVDGDGIADTGAALDALAITPAERVQLAQLYPSGKSIWRALLPHLSIYDLNYAYVLPADATPPNTVAAVSDLGAQCCTDAGGARVDGLTQTAVESQPIVGTPYSLVYESDRVEGRSAARSIRIQLTGSTISPSVARVDLHIDVAGVTVERTFPPAPNLTYTFDWDGRDAFGRLLQGPQPIHVRTSWAYPAVYSGAPRFALKPTETLTFDDTRSQTVLSSEETVHLKTFDVTPIGLGGWEVNVHHPYDPSAGAVFGECSVSRGRDQGPIINNYAGGGTTPVADGVMPLQAQLSDVDTLTVGPDGSVYFIDHRGASIWKIPPSGPMVRVAGTGLLGYDGDEKPATQAKIDPYFGQIVMAPGCDGGFYFSDYNNHRIRHVDGRGIIHTVVGNGERGRMQTNILATEANLLDAPSLAVGPDGSLYVGDLYGKIARVTSDGWLTVVGGNYEGGPTADNVPALQAGGMWVAGLAVGRDGTIYVGDSDGVSGWNGRRIRSIGSDGIIRTVVGGGTVEPLTEGMDPLTAQLTAAGIYVFVGLDASGALYFAQEVVGRMREVWTLTREGSLHLVAGQYRANPFDIRQRGNGGPASAAGLVVQQAAIGPDGSIFTSSAFEVRRISPTTAHVGDAQFVPSQDGREVYVYDSSGRHLRTVDALTNATRLTFGYDTDGRLSTIRDAAGNVTTFTHDADGRPTSVVAPRGQTTSLTTDGDGFLAQITNPGSETVAMTYAPGKSGLLASYRDAAGGQSQFDYDDRGRLTRFQNPAGGTLTLASSELTAGRAVLQSTGLGVTSAYSHESPSSGTDTKTTTLPDGRTLTQSLLLDGTQTTKLANGTTTTVLQTPDPRFQMLAPVASKIGSRTPAGLAYEQTLSRSVVLADALNPLSLVSLTDTTTVDPSSGLGFTTTFDASSRVFALSTPAGRSQMESLDAFGRLARTQRGGLAASTFGYDTLGRLSTIAQGTRTRAFAYDDSGMLATVTDPAQQSTSFRRDAVGRVTEQTLPDGAVVAFSYDASGRLSSMTPPGRAAHLFTHSALGSLTSYVAPSVPSLPSATTRWTYDADGRLGSYQRADGTSVIARYDTSGRLSSVTAPAGATVVAYDPTSGRPTTATTAAGDTTAFAYDGSLSTQTSWSGAVNGNVSWGYDKFQKLVWEKVNGGNGVGYAYDNDGLVKKAGAMTITSSDDGLLSGTALGSVTDTITYDGFGSRAGYVASVGGTAIFSVTTTQDSLGRIATRSEAANGQTHQFNYTYDSRGRLTDVTNDGASEGHWTYDANGNRTSETTPARSRTASFDAQDRMLTNGTLVYAYGPDGELLTKTDTSTGATTSYTYDTFGNLIHATLPNGKQIAYVVDAAGRRIARKVDGTTTTQWLYRDSRRPVAELDGTGNLRRRFVYADGSVADKSVLTSIRERLGVSRGSRLTSKDLARPMYIVEGTQVLRVITDHLGSPRYVVDAASGIVVQSVTYDAWGAVTEKTGTDLPTFGFAGGLVDPDTGLVHFGAREYDPEAGRWTSKEPLKNGGVLNLYEYATNDPLNTADLDGLAKASSPSDQAVLDSICGPNAEGEVSCNRAEVEDALEQAVALLGAAAASAAATDATSQTPPSVDVPPPAPDMGGDATTSSGPVDVGGGPAPVNNPPIVSVGSPTLNLTMPALNIPLNGSVTDDGLPSGAGLQSLWYAETAPSDPAFAHEERPDTTVSFPVGGVYQLVLLASDGEYSRSASLTVNVTALPEVTASGPASVAVGDAAQFVGTAHLPVTLPGRTLSTIWTKVSGPGSVTIASPGALTTDATFGAPGDYVLQLEATDGYATAAAQVELSVHPVNHPPTASAGTSQTIPAPGTMAILSGSASDDGLPEGSSLSYAWSVISGPAAVTIANPSALTTGITFSYPGTYAFQLTVSDTEKVATAITSVTIQAPAGDAVPQLAVAGITDDAVVTKPTDILATISDGAWVLEYRRGGRDDVERAWSVLASGSGAANNARLATFDPTLLQNGFYTVRLSATTSAGEANVTVGIAVDGRMKVGNFTLTFTDLESVVGNLPFLIDRTYDSRDKDVGDFGVGWKLGIRDIRVEKSGKIGAYWTQTFENLGVIGKFCLFPSQSNTITVTFPNGRQYRFKAKSNPTCQTNEAFTDMELDFECVSDPDSPTIKLTASQRFGFLSGSVGPNQLLDGNFEVLDSRQFQLTTEDGMTYDLDQDEGVKQITDLNGNTLSVTPNGIFHSSGKSIRFTRDAKHRITSIVDPMGAAMTYDYDANGDLASYTDRTTNKATFAYASTHYLEEILDPLGRRPIRCEYDDDGRLLSQRDADGHSITYVHDISAAAERIVDRLGHTTVYEYNDMGDVTRMTDANGAVWQYSVDSRGNKLSETDPVGHTTSATYDGDNNTLSTSDALGHVTTYTYGVNKRCVTMSDPRGAVTSYGYDREGNMVSLTDSLGRTKTYTHDTHGNTLTETDALNHTTRYTYDGEGHATQKLDALDHVTTYAYDADGRRVSETTSRTSEGATQLLVTNYQYDASGRPVRTTYPDLTSTTSSYSATGKVTARVDELGRKTSYTYDGQDRLITTTRPDGTTESVGYDAENRRVSSTDAASRTTSYRYDNVGRLVATTHADGTLSSVAYDAAGRVTSTVDELGYPTTTTYDAAGRRLTTTDPTGGVTQFAYDESGNSSAVTDPSGRTTVMTYNLLGRVVAAQFADMATESSHFDEIGRLTSKEDPLGRVTTFGYDALGQVTSITDALNHVTTFAYDEVGNRVMQTDANGHTTAFTFDGRGRITKRTLPDGAFETRAFDGAGQVAARTDFMGRTTTYSYDPMGRLLSRTYPDSTSVGFTYTPTGRRATTTDSRGITSYTYDTRDRMLTMLYPDGQELDYAYDPRGARTKLTAKVGASALTMTTRYDGSGRATEVFDPTGRKTTLSYDAAGQRTDRAYPNGTDTSYTYDARGRVTRIHAVAGSTDVTSFEYTLDAAGRRSRLDETAGVTRTYGYDAIDRLTSETVTGALAYAKTFSYDPVGNRLAQTTTGAGAQVISYTYDTRDRLATENAARTFYDANGNTVLDSGEAAYTWDFDNRLMSVATSSDAMVHHVYDVDGTRVKTTVTPTSGPASVTNMLVDNASGLSHVVAETDQTGTLTALYVRQGDELLAVMRPTAPGTWSTRWVHHDALGSVRALTDEAGVVSDTRGYEAFGTMNVEAGSDPLPYRFAGEPFDSTSRLAFHRARWMDARVGRFQGMDPKVETRDMRTRHVYAYASMNPLNATDPTGEFDVGGLSISMSINIGVDAVPSMGSVTQSIMGSIAGSNRIQIGEPLHPEMARQGWMFMATELSRAIQYLSLTSTGTKLLGSLKSVSLKQSIWKVDGQDQTINGWVVKWDPFTAVRLIEEEHSTSPTFTVTTRRINRGVVSPALALAHELGHTVSGGDEHEILDKWEIPIAWELAFVGFNESIRETYGFGEPVDVKDSTDRGPGW